MACYRTGHILISEMLKCGKTELTSMKLAPLMVLVINACPFGQCIFIASGGGWLKWGPGSLFHAFLGKLQATEDSGSCGESKPCSSSPPHPTPSLKRKGKVQKLNALRAVGMEELKAAQPAKVRSVSSRADWVGTARGSDRSFNVPGCCSIRLC